MTLQEIIDFTRYRLNNYESPYVWLDSELVLYCNEAINRMCREALVLEDSTTASVCEIHTTANTLDYALAASIIYVRSAVLVTKELLTLDVAPSTAWSVGDTITGASSTKTCIVVEKLTDYTYVVNKRTGTFTLGEILSNGTYTADQGAAYPTFKDYELDDLQKTTVYDMGKFYPAWRTATANEPTRFMLDYNTGYITVYPKPDDIYLLRLTVFRYPITAMSATSMSAQTPEIDSKYHDVIINGICGQAWLKSGDNTFDLKKADAYLKLFNKSISEIKIKNLRFMEPERTLSPHKAFI